MIAVIKSGLANISSVVFALERLGFDAIVTDDAKTIEQADHVILPGVGTAQAAMKNLKALNLIPVIKNLQQPVLGVCLGMQLLFEFSSEGDVDCLGIFPGKITKLVGDNLIVPHMGWNTLNSVKPNNTLLKNIPQNAYVYFVHSYCALVNEHTVASTHYGQDFTAIVQKNNFYGMQFHPERSGGIGEQLLRNFITI
jgi:glutamine amidotransferase